MCPDHSVFAATSSPTDAAASSPPSAAAPAVAITSTPRRASTTWPAPVAAALILRLRVPETSRDLAWNKAEINRVLATERIDPDAARLMLWAMDLATAALRAESACRPRRAQNRASNPNEIYDVALNPLFPQSLSETLSQMIENTMRQGEGY